MDFEDERYVRLYTRNTPTWCSWRWEARAVLPHLLRALDRNGRLEWPPGDDAIAVAAVLLLPVKVVAVGLQELARTRTITLGEGWLEMPNFVVGQNARSRALTGAERTAKHRARKASEGGLVTRGDAPSHRVTESNECNPQRSVAERSYAELTPPTPSQGVTASPANDLPGEEPIALTLATAPTRKRRGKPRSTVPPEFLEGAYAAFSDAREALTGRRPKGLSAEMLDQMAKLYAAHSPTLEDWQAVVGVRLGMDQRGEGYGSLTWASLTAPKNFERWLLEAHRPRTRPKQLGRAEVSSRPTQSGVLDLRALATKDPR